MRPWRSQLPQHQHTNLHAPPTTASGFVATSGPEFYQNRQLRRNARQHEPADSPTPAPHEGVITNPFAESPHSHPSGASIHQPARQQVYPLGTREDVEQEDYQSPVGLLFQGAYERYRTAEQVRQDTALRLGVPVNTIRTINSMAQHNGYLDSQGHPPEYVTVGQPIYPGTGVQLAYPLPYRTANMPFTSLLNRNPPPAPVIDPPTENNENGENPIDRQSHRPEPLKVEDMNVNIACKMCMEQRIDTLIEPCMHLAMCRWCSDVWQLNARKLRQMDPLARHPWKCPVCRKAIQQVRRVYF